MSTTYLELQTKVSRAIQDPDNATFPVQTIKDIIQAAWAEIGRIAPHKFVEDIDPVIDQTEYQLRTDFTVAGANLVVNPSFETNAASEAHLTTAAAVIANITGWTMPVTTAPAGSYAEVMNDTAEDGLWSTLLAWGGTVAGSLGLTAAATFPVAPGSVYHIRAWVRGDVANTGVAGANIIIKTYNSAGTLLQNVSPLGVVDVAAGDWQQIEGDMVMGSTVRSVRFSVYNDTSSDPNAIVGFDNLEFFRVYSTTTFSDPVDEVEVMAVELRDNSGDRVRSWKHIDPQSAHPWGLAYSQAGWRVWGGVLYLPDRVVDLIDPDKHTIRVWGYSPFPPVVADNDVIPFGADREEALVIYCYVEALRRLIGNRALFTQWQTRSNNSDISFAGLASDFNMAQTEWKRRAGAIFVPREAP